MDVKQKLYSDPKRWTCIYPAYIDSKKSAAEGRRIRKDRAVESPTSQEIFDIVNHLGFKCELEKNKMYPRNELRDQASQGRVRIQFLGDNGRPVNADFKKKQILFLHLAEMIPKLKSRQAGGQEQQNASSGQGGGKQKKKK